MTARGNRDLSAFLIGASACTSERRSALAPRVRELAGEADWTALAETLLARRLLPILGPRLIDMSDGRAPSEFAHALERAADAAVKHGALLDLVGTRVMSMLGEEGIRAAALKGPGLSERIHGDPGRRVSADVDLLVEAQALPATVAVVRRLGYLPPSDHVDRDGLPLLHFLMVHEREELPPVELHWRIHWYERAFARERLLPPSAAQWRAWRPQPVDELLSLLLFYARDGFVDLRLATDLSAWWDSCGPSLEADALQRRLEEHPALRRVATVAAEVAQSTVGLPAARLINRPGPARPRERLAMRLANPNPRGDAAQLYAEMGLVDGLLAPPGGFAAFVRRQILPPRQVRQEHARALPGRRRRARSSAVRALGTLARYSLAVGRAARAPRALG